MIDERLFGCMSECMSVMQVGDSIVRKSRETLERAIHLVENTPRWAAKVVYGDTDRSLFLCVSVCVFGCLSVYVSLCLDYFESLLFEM